MKMRDTADICPCRDDAQPHIYEGGYCVLCGVSLKNQLKARDKPKTWDEWYQRYGSQDNTK